MIVATLAKALGIITTTYDSTSGAVTTNYDNSKLVQLQNAMNKAAKELQDGKQARHADCDEDNWNNLRSQTASYMRTQGGINMLLNKDHNQKHQTVVAVSFRAFVDKILEYYGN